MMGKSSGLAVLLLLLVVLLLAPAALAQLSKPVAHDDNMKERLKDNKFAQRQASDDSSQLPPLDEEEVGSSQCPQNLELRWQTEVGSSIYATPLITDINGDGKLEIVVSSLVHYLEVLEGSDGEKLTGWPLQHQSTVHASPLMYDIDKDGYKEIALATFGGEVLFFRGGGYHLPDKLTVPRLKVRKDWYVGLDPDHVDRSNPDVHDDSLTQQQSGKTATVGDLLPNSNTKRRRLLQAETVEEGNSGAAEGQSTTTTTTTTSESKGEETPNTKDETQQDVSKTTATDSKVEETVDANVETQEVLKTAAATDSKVEDTQDATGGKENVVLPSTTTASDSTVKEEGGEQSQKPNDETIDSVPTVEDPDDPMEDDALASFDVFRDEDENGEDGLTEEYAYDYDDYVNEDMWGDEEWDHVAHHTQMEEFIEVDAHILATPVIADIDKDGIDEMVIAVSYFYDHDYYDAPEHAKEVGENLDLSKYVAGGIVVFNLDSRQVKWNIQLDQSTDSTTFRAYIYSAPTVVDLDGDGYLDILVGTSMGFVYAIDHAGRSRKQFPLQMGEVQGQVVAADINDDGKIEIVSTDTRGNVAAWTTDGKEVWEVHLKSLISQGVTVGDVDGDGRTDLVVTTTCGNIYVLKGSDGSNVGGFPFRTHGRVMAPALLVDLSKRGEEKKGLTIAVGSFDGYFYLIDGPTRCADAIDIGETSYSMALADNVDGGDDLDILVTTMNGNVYCFQTPAPHHPLKAWPAQTQGRNVLSSRHQREGIYVLPSSRGYKDQAGDTFHVTFEIVDKHTIPSGALGPYDVKVTLMTPMNYRGDKKSVYNYTYELPGVYTVTLPCLPTRTSASLIVEMLDKNSLYFYDEFSLTFHMHYYQILKWLLTLPLLASTCIFLLFPAQENGVSLPSFTRERHQL